MSPWFLGHKIQTPAVPVSLLLRWTYCNAFCRDLWVCSVSFTGVRNKSYSERKMYLWHNLWYRVIMIFLFKLVFVLKYVVLTTLVASEFDLWFLRAMWFFYLLGIVTSSLHWSCLWRRELAPQCQRPWFPDRKGWSAHPESGIGYCLK